MSLPILTILGTADPKQIRAAIAHTANCLHVPEGAVTAQVAVGYVREHYQAGDLTGWDGFAEITGG